MDSASVTPPRPACSAGLLAHLGRLMQLRADSSIDSLGLRLRHFVALTVLRDHGELTQQALSVALQIDRTNLVGLLNELEADHLVERRRAFQDRRRHIVELTAQGRARLADAESAIAAAEDDILSALAPDQRQTLYDLLQQATSNHVINCTTDHEAVGDLTAA